MALSMDLNNLFKIASDAASMCIIALNDIFDKKCESLHGLIKSVIGAKCESAINIFLNTFRDITNCGLNW
ncbi:unnamed protein product [Ceutorhynchus assimilis]|uniref:Uncharacterized protein n=1 Tax=Ceutorhynchus assimilis TaxID=467358 RepID=A0A9N9MPR4_9CUCU|nr:unnamed protein product [Ceutorhynchus assimilis]